MLSNKLPEAIASFVFASNAHQTDDMLAAFADDAVLTDDNRVFEGKTAIREWSDGEYIGSRVNLTILDSVFEAEEPSLRVEINGDYPNCPYFLIFPLEWRTI
ncbi:nuclear transport factor 2 family protein [Paenibacillus gorillae]|uniref:nuclear transport factor 2 family protein n=1 Tax=Paenibacillus gorillae TaxID=1243662 RepID=UPI0004BCDC83|nr:nuclear transport factor 2 family protein [Paenibacillus gorillae]